MKTMKKFASLALALIMALALAVPAFAVDPTGSITITKPENVDETATYKVYEVFGLTRAEDATDESGYAYTATTAIKNLVVNATGNYAAVANYFTFTQVGTTDVWNVVPTTTYNAAAAKVFSQFLADSVASLGNPVKTITVESDAVSDTVGGLAYGYYFVDSTVGTLCMLNSSTPDVTIEDKNQEPGIDKTVNMTAQDRIGSTVEYTIPIEITEGATNYVLYDVMSAGLTYNNDLAIGLADSATGTATTYTGDDAYSDQTLVETNEIFRIRFADSFLEGNEGKWIIVTYSATINSNAVAVNNNSATLNYGNGHSVTTGNKPNQPDVNLYSFQVKKTDGTNELTGAKFKLYDAQTNGTEILVAENTDSTKDYDYVVTTNANVAVEIEAGTVTIFGLGNGTYYLEETEAPQGYNKLTERRELTINGADLTGDTGVEVINQSGAVLPSTGGIGTTIFYIGGGILVAGAAILLITKKRMGAAE